MKSDNIAAHGNIVVRKGILVFKVVMAHQVLLMQMMSMFGCACCSSDDGNSNIIATLPNCSYPSVYAFGDSMTDTGNGIAGFPDEFISSESDPNGILFPQHAADRYCDGRLLIDFLGKKEKPTWVLGFRVY
jgi:hypothetical protein